ncbi:MAG: pyridoxal kinase [Pseudomonadota bacterium]
MTILAISSQVVAGHVGNSAAQFVLQTLGHEVWAIPTVLLSHHPGHGTPAGRGTPAAEIEALLDNLWTGGWMDQVTAVMTGYFTSNDQIDAAANTISRLKHAKPDLPVLIDPILGDNGTVYVHDSVPPTLRDALMPLATITTPNLFELATLTKLLWPLEDKGSIDQAALSLSIAEVLVTSAPGTSPETISTRVYAQDNDMTLETQRAPSPPNGIGDVMASSYLAMRLRGAPPKSAATAASQIVSGLIETAVRQALAEVPLVGAGSAIREIAENA